MIEREHCITDEAAMLEFGAILALAAQPGDIYFLQGQLGAGKTTLARGFLRALGCRSIVRSPTYTLVESYCLDKAMTHHFDLYRLSNPHEIEDLGLRDYLTEHTISLIEWPEKAGKYLPEATLCCTISALENDQPDRRLITLKTGQKDVLQRFSFPNESNTRKQK